MWMNDALLNQFSLLGSSAIYTAIIGIPLFLFMKHRDKKKRNAKNPEIKH